ncbi:MAG: hypothetical protein KDE08_04525 [Rhodobacteraceae bacterium]|nr:hypothetical protein [Paracoccaceae bacterium]
MAGHRLKVVSTVVAAFTAAPAIAGGPFKAPDGCEVFATVQMRSCQVSQHYRCAGEPGGNQWAVYSDGDGPYFMSQIDAETRWIDSIDLFMGQRDHIIAEADPASFTTLTAGGRDDYDFKTESDNGEIRHYVGNDRLTGEKVVIDGITLERTKFEMAAMDENGVMIWRRKGQQLISRDWRLFFGDKETFENAEGEVVESTDTPVTFALPGEAGFLDNDPAYDCNVVDASFVPVVARQGS